MVTPLDNARVEIAWDSGFSTAEGSRTWTDVTRDVSGADGISIGYGRTDQQPSADPNSLTLTLKNDAGKYTPGNASSPYSPNVKKGKPIRVSVRYPAGQSGNLLTANQASMETSIADWTAGGSVPPALSSSTLHVDNGTKALLITWGTGGTLPAAQTVATGLTVGRTYTAQARVYVPTGSPNVRLVQAGGSIGAVTSTKDAFATISVTFTATASSHGIQVWPSGAPTAGNQCWVDSVMLDEGSTVGTFTTTAPPIYTRFTGYVNEWPVVWPTGSDQSSSVTITAASRRARLGQTAPLTSAIRAAYLATSPYAYWPLTDNLTNTEGRYVFLDVTNTIVNQKATQLLGVFNTLPAAVIVNDVAQGPTDEGTLVKIPAFTDSSLIGTFARYVGAGTAVNVDPANDLTIEAVIRINVNTAAVALATVFTLRSRDLTTSLEVAVGNDGPDFGWVAESFTIRDATTNAVQDQQISASAPAPYNTATFNSVNDGELHHLAVTLSSAGTVAKFYIDGALESTLTVASPFKFSQRFTNFALGSNAFNATLWIGHAAIHTRALTAAEILTHAQAARAVLETPGDRVVRVAGRIGVPAAEVDVEASAAVAVGPQPEAGRSAVEVLDELAASTGGILYDARTGHLAMQSRNHRYNAANAFTLNTASEEIEVDLTTVLNDQYLVNTVELSRIGVEDATPTTLSDATSVSDYGVYSKSMQLASSSDEEVLAAGQDQLVRYATPRTRISQVSVDIGDLSTAQRDLVLTARVGTLFTISGLPVQAPAPSMPLFVEGYAESISAGSGHIITFNTTPGDLYTNVLILDDPAHDVLDSGITLAY